MIRVVLSVDILVGIGGKELGCSLFKAIFKLDGGGHENGRRGSLIMFEQLIVVHESFPMSKLWFAYCSFDVLTSYVLIKTFSLKKTHCSKCFRIDVDVNTLTKYQQWRHFQTFFQSLLEG